MGPRRTAGFRAAAIALALCPATGVGTPAAGVEPAPAVTVLAVPYVPQSGELCGGAAIAMVQRHWGRTSVQAEDFAAWLDPGGHGILTGTMVTAVAAEGWTALPLAGTPTTVSAHLAAGRPVIALLETGADVWHYVVLVAWANGWVIFHDPAVGPFRARREGAFVDAWSGSGAWALLILPPAVTAAPAAPDPAAPDPAVAAPSPPAATDGCDALVQAGILLAEQEQTVDAELSFLAAEALCPGSSAPLAERAGLRFRAGDWAGAGRLAERALALDPADGHTRRLLAGSRFLAGDVGGALDAWNRLAEPRLDLVRIDGLMRVRYAVVADQLGLRPGRLLTAGDWRRARRRLGELPAAWDSRLGLRLLPAGLAQVEATVLERPLVRAGPWDVARTAVRAVVGREVALDVASPTGRGELWTIGGRLSRERPAVFLALAVPAAGRRPGVWRVEGLWERQTYAFPATSAEGQPTGTMIQVEERRRTALSFADWTGPDVRCRLGLALDRWADRGAHLSLAAEVETRCFGDRLALKADAARWLSVEDGAPFGTAGLSCRWRSSAPDGNDAWQGLVGFSQATAEAPLALWQGAGTGYGRDPLLRAHPLLDGGVIAGRIFGRRLVHATIERQTWSWRLGPLTCAWALFVDTAGTEATERTAPAPWQVDGGTGLRVKNLGPKGQLRLDVAHGFTDGETAWSIDWRLP